jgi:hypothetical protein
LCKYAETGAIACTNGLVPANNVCVSCGDVGQPTCAGAINVVLSVCNSPCQISMGGVLLREAVHLETWRLHTWHCCCKIRFLFLLVGFLEQQQIALQVANARKVSMQRMACAPNSVVTHCGTAAPVQPSASPKVSPVDPPTSVLTAATRASPSARVRTPSTATDVTSQLSCKFSEPDTLQLVCIHKKLTSAYSML